MPLVATRGAASAQGFGEFAVTSTPTYIEDVFSCFLYTGTGSAQTITNGIDLSTKGGLVWTKFRDSALSTSHTLNYGSNGNYVVSNNTGGSGNSGNSWNTTGFNVGPYLIANQSGVNYASWTFRKQPKFFDVVTYTGTGSNTTIAHNLGAVPGSIIVKRTDTSAAWAVYHRSLANTQYLVLNTTAAAATGATWWNSTTPTSSVFSVGTDASVNASGGTYVAYLFANDAGGFGLTGTDNVITCGSFTTDGSGNASVNLGYEPQFWLYKPNLAARYWTIYDVMRGWSQTYIANLNPNVTDAEGGGAATLFYPTATGFDCVGSALDANTQHIYIAIRRGPMKVPTLGTSVYNAIARTGTGAAATVTAGFPVDMTIIQDRNGLNSYAVAFDRLRGATKRLFTALTLAEATEATSLTGFDVQTGFTLGTDLGFGAVNTSPDNYVNWCFGRAPGFFDEVCYTGTGVNGQVINHNLSAIPEMVIIKARDGNLDWFVYQEGLSFGNSFYLNRNYAQSNDGGPAFSLSTTALTISRTYVSTLNNSGLNYVAYLFATCPGVSKVGSYTGNGTTQTINCGFTGGARFVLIKRTDSTGNWYVWDSARGIVAGNDPYLLLNSTAAEVTSTDYIDTYSAGFEISSTAPAAINASAGTFVFLAVA